MTPVDVRLQTTAPHKVITVSGWDVGVPGVAVVETPDGIKADCRTWAVVHTPSGCLFYGRTYKSPEGAVAFSHALAGKYDWTRSGADLINDEVRSIVHAALLAYMPDVEINSPNASPDELKDCPL